MHNKVYNKPEHSHPSRGRSWETVIFAIIAWEVEIWKPKGVPSRDAPILLVSQNNWQHNLLMYASEKAVQKSLDNYLRFYKQPHLSEARH